MESYIGKKVRIIFMWRQLEFGRLPHCCPDLPIYITGIFVGVNSNKIEIDQEDAKTFVDIKEVECIHEQ